MKGSYRKLLVRLLASLEHLLLQTLFPCFICWVLSCVVTVQCGFGDNHASDVILTYNEMWNKISHHLWSFIFLWCFSEELIIFQVRHNMVIFYLFLTLLLTLENVCCVWKNWKNNQQFCFPKIFLTLVLKFSY